MKIGIYSGAIPPPVFINNLINGLVDKNDTVILYVKALERNYKLKQITKYNFGYDKDEVNILGVCGTIEEGENKEYIELIDFISSSNLSVNTNF